MEYLDEIYEAARSNARRMRFTSFYFYAKVAGVFYRINLEDKHDCQKVIRGTDFSFSKITNINCETEKYDVYFPSQLYKNINTATIDGEPFKEFCSKIKYSKFSIETSSDVVKEVLEKYFSSHENFYSDQIFNEVIDYVIKWVDGTISCFRLHYYTNPGVICCKLNPDGSLRFRLRAGGAIKEQIIHVSNDFIQTAKQVNLPISSCVPKNQKRFYQRFEKYC